MYSGETIGDAKKKTLISNVINFAPLSTSKLALFRRILAPNKLAAGELGSS